MASAAATVLHDIFSSKITIEEVTIFMALSLPTGRMVSLYFSKLKTKDEDLSLEKIFERTRQRHQPDIWGLTKGMLQSIYILLLKTIPFLVQQNVGLVPVTSV
jgi:hypothetical protein